ncbi:PREDICTED: putative lysine-specific demethylase JMJ16 isoform X1 [Camelina sativa]|uniref:Lysine-specific demethylase JMJ16 isoform X1 n=1 Tax=Camelina sativa TaxID=90675 RepID=A0ABM1RIR4_CAMSA|nr:PREDICTED: putative lysine-specific demethylase JMJ16 isoform X2 [Camelina sativa]XP_010489120.1 PREDICTED: putative lysine-specific demethylase JMJ16 isoform X1 [Camelina sativa]XP_019098901.1 PREDICTED: putative lysine-specific demethylase JMJ16 isoform X1 [Camelina sativa]XP_019098902.1 PREDICTED: putative lysine-specific demethylase JMJ16 isoform X1 [Camelina sativa]XP_019098903.1 PREDICTED: putative lysine-specific demethylase JMJ16 isoform X1 [Camelina sativa]
MGTELMRICVKDESDDLPSVPPGFESYATFTLKRLPPGSSDKAMPPPIETVPVTEQPKMEIESDESKAAPSLRRIRPWINIDDDDDVANNDNAASQQHLDQNSVVEPSLPKGVVRGCEECKDCQKVTAKWHPDEARRPDLEDAPVFYPSEEEFEDTLSYIAKIRPQAEKYGICRIVPPPSWKPPCPLKEKQVWEGSKFATRVQRVDKLQNRSSMKKISKLSNQMRKKKRKCIKTGTDSVTNGMSDSCSASTGMSELETFGFEPGPGFTLKDFQKYADDFKAQYFKKSETSTDNDCIVGNSIDCWEPAVEDVEGEYWRIVDKATEEIEVLYGADLETGVFGSGFPKTSSSHNASSSEEIYARSGWNLNNFPRLPGSLLKYEGSDISGVLVPWLYIGMCFSSFCWHVEDHHLYSLNYMHWGAPKLWYGVGGKDAVKLEDAMRKHLPDLFEEQPDLLHKLVTQLSPSKLKTAGVPVHRCVQHAGEFVLTFPRAYHAGFNSGFNCAEAVNVAPVDWLPHGQIAIELYCQQGRKTSISHDKLLLGAAREVVKADWELNLLKKNTVDNLRWKAFSGKDGILAKTLKARIDMERTKREFLCNTSLALKMHSNFDATNERECCICFFDLHLSAAGCRCSPEKYSCLSHVKQLCSCSWVTKYFLFRYDIDELNVLVEAVEGKLSSVYRWARQDLGLALTTQISGTKMEIDEEEKVHKDLSPQAAAISAKDLQLKVTLREDLSKGLEKTSKLSDVNLLLKDKEEQLTSSHCIKPVKEETVYDSSDPKVSACQSSEGGILSVTTAKSVSGKKNSQILPNDVILLSDDEHDKPRKRGSVRRDAVSSGNKLDVRERPTHVLALEASAKIAAPVCRRLGDSLPHTRNAISLPTNVQRATRVDVPSSASHMEVNAEAGGLAQDICNRINTNNHGGEKATSCKPKKSGGLVILDVVDGARSNSGTPSCSQNNSPDGFIRQKGPRIAKVVRRINCNVEPLSYGCVFSGKSWCSRRAIFPKGFRSRVRYLNILDPRNMCFYISEILDAGRDSPLFMVYLESNPSEVFVHLSPTRCWEMVKDRVNQEISKQHKAGKSDLPPLQPAGSPDGFEMFGYSSPAIVQAIEALDVNRVCTDYWDSRPYSRPQVQFPANPLPREANSSVRSLGVGNLQNAPQHRLLPTGTNSILKVLFKKANMEELSSLQEVLSESNSDLATELVKEELQNRR